MSLFLEANPSEKLVLLTKQVEASKQSSNREWLRQVLKSPAFVCASRWPGGLLAVVLAESFTKDTELPKDVHVQHGWAVLRLNKADLEPKVALSSLSSLTVACHEAGLPMHAVSTPVSEHLLVRTEDFSSAVLALLRAGHALAPAALLSPITPKDAMISAGSRRSVEYAGLWTLIRAERPAGTGVAEYGEDDGPLRLQSSCGLFAEVWIEPTGDATGYRCCSGSLEPYTHGKPGAEAGGSTALRRCITGFQPPVSATEEPSPVELALDEGRTVLVETGLPSGRLREMWVRLEPEERCVAMRLVSESVVGSAAGHRLQRDGCWVFCGSRFARILGLPRGQGVVGGTCCKSLEQLKRARGTAAVQTELSSYYEAMHGILEKPGLLRISRQAWGSGGGVFFDAADSNMSDSVSIPEELGGELVHRLPNGTEQRWQVLEWGFDPFTPGGDRGPLNARAASLSSDEREAKKTKKDKKDKSKKKAKKAKKKQRSSSDMSQSSKDVAQQEDRGKKKKRKKDSSESSATTEDEKKKKKKKKKSKKEDKESEASEEKGQAKSEADDLPSKATATPAATPAAPAAPAAVLSAPAAPAVLSAVLGVPPVAVPGASPATAPAAAPAFAPVVPLVRPAAAPQTLTAQPLAFASAASPLTLPPAAPLAPQAPPLELQAQSLAQPGAQLEAQPAAQLVAQPVAQPEVQPMAQPDAQPVALPVAQLEEQAQSQPAVHSDALPAARPVVQPLLQPMAQTVAQPFPPPVAPPVAQPMAQPTMLDVPAPLAATRMSAAATVSPAAQMFALASLAIPVTPATARPTLVPSAQPEAPAAHLVAAPSSALSAGATAPTVVSSAPPTTPWVAPSAEAMVAPSSTLPLAPASACSPPVTMTSAPLLPMEVDDVHVSHQSLTEDAGAAGPEMVAQPDQGTTPAATLPKSVSEGPAPGVAPLAAGLGPSSITEFVRRAGLNELVEKALNELSGELLHKVLAPGLPFANNPSAVVMARIRKAEASLSTKTPAAVMKPDSAVPAMPPSTTVPAQLDLGIAPQGPRSAAAVPPWRQKPPWR